MSNNTEEHHYYQLAVKVSPEKNFAPAVELDYHFTQEIIDLTIEEEEIIDLATEEEKIIDLTVEDHVIIDLTPTSPEASPTTQSNSNFSYEDKNDMEDDPLFFNEDMAEAFKEKAEDVQSRMDLMNMHYKTEVEFLQMQIDHLTKEVLGKHN